MEYRNIDVDITHPTTTRDFTALAILTALNAAGGRMLTADLDAAIIAGGGEPALRDEAVKALRNRGHEIECDKARHLSAWWVNPTTDELEDGRQRRVREGYSQAVTNARMMHGQLMHRPGDPQAISSHKQAVLTAIDFGTDVAVGMSIHEVVADCVPLTAP